jgi:hypothetical protein
VTDSTVCLTFRKERHPLGFIVRLLLKSVILAFFTVPEEPPHQLAGTWAWEPGSKVTIVMVSGMGNFRVEKAFFVEKP